MRVAGPAPDVRGLGLHDHLCWGYSDSSALRDRVVQFLADGIALGQRAAYIGPAPWDELRDDLEHLDGRDDLLASDGLQLSSATETYGTGAIVDGERQVATYAAATEQALAAGYTGLRVAADITMLVRTPAQRAAVARYEHLVDRYMTTKPFAAMCAYSETELGPAVAELASLHPAAAPGNAPFHLFATDERSGLGLTGEIDLACAGLFADGLERTTVAPGDTVVGLDATGVGFIDHRALLAVERHAARRGVDVVLTGSLPTLDRLVQLLELRHVRMATES